MKKTVKSIFLSISIISVLVMVFLLASCKDGDCEHPYTSVEITETAPSCTVRGEKVFKCTKCNTTLKIEVYKDALGHTWDEGKTIVAPTCDKMGTRKHTCRVCETEKITSVTALGHEWNTGSIVKPATCTQNGVAMYLCLTCGTTKQETISASHSWGAGVVIKPATFAEPGIMAYACTQDGCEATKIEEIPATGDAPESGAECEHVYDEGVVATVATCTTDGVKIFTCTVCGETKTEEIPATGEHTEEVFAAVAPTCGATGLTEGKKCSVCDTVTVAQEEVPATGEHTEEVVAAVAPTCTATGLTEGKKCSVCDTVLVDQEEVEALGHTFVAAEPVLDETGFYNVYACACGEEKNVKDETYVVVTTAEAAQAALDAAVANQKIVLYGDKNFGTITLSGELENVTITAANGAKVSSIVIAADANINGLTIKDASFATEGGVYFFNKDNAAVVKNVVFDGCTFDGTNLSNNVINIWTDVENLTVNACEFKNLDWNTFPIMLNGTTLGEVNITNNVADNFAQRFVRVANAQTGTITITGNTLTNWMYIEGTDTNDAEIFKASDCAEEVVITFENNTLDGVALGALEVDGANLVVKADKTNETETPDYVAP